MDKFILVLGQENNILPGKAWKQYEVEVKEKEMVCTDKKDTNNVVTISYDSFKEAEFGIAVVIYGYNVKLKKKV